jgi:hypothetical protein
MPLKMGSIRVHRLIPHGLYVYPSGKRPYYLNNDN